MPQFPTFHFSPGRVKDLSNQEVFHLKPKYSIPAIFLLIFVSFPLNVLRASAPPQQTEDAQAKLFQEHMDRAVALKARGDMAGAIEQYGQAETLRPELFDPHFYLGLVLEAHGDIDEAIAQNQAALRIKPDSAAAHINLGSALSDKGDLEGAVSEFRAAVHLQ